MPQLLLAVTLMLCLALIPLGLPGLWLMIGAAALYGPLSGLAPFGWASLGVAVAVAGVAEGIEFLLAGHFAKQYGGSRRAGWGAIGGGVAGALIGVPVPIVGSMIGAFLGAFAGAFLAEMTTGTAHDSAMKVATGALIGRIVAVTVKIALGFVIAAWLVGVALWPSAPPTPSPAAVVFRG